MTNDTNIVVILTISMAFYKKIKFLVIHTSHLYAEIIVKYLQTTPGPGFEPTPKTYLHEWTRRSTNLATATHVDEHQVTHHSSIGGRGLTDLH